MDGPNAILARREGVRLAGGVRERSHGSDSLFSKWTSRGKHINLIAIGSLSMNKGIRNILKYTGH